MIERHLTPRLIEAFADTPVALLLGARQTGKSTLALSMRAAGDVHGYVSLDDPIVASAASADPSGFLRGLPVRVALDEVQSVPALLPAIKRLVDSERHHAGGVSGRRFLLTGSANLFMLPGVGESLAGRMQLETLWPLSQGEIDGAREGLLDDLFRGRGVESSDTDADANGIVERIGRGGFPELLGRPHGRRVAWLESYVAALMQRDIRDLTRTGRLADIRRVLNVLAARAPNLLNVAALARDAQLPPTSVERYVRLLESLFLVLRIPAWHSNTGQRFLKSPKVLICDSALQLHLIGAGPDRLTGERERLGPLLENFVGMELVKQAGWGRARRVVHHLRTAKGAEVDFVVEDDAGRLVAIEVKASATVRSDDFRWIRGLARSVGDRFVRGVVLHLGEAGVQFADDLIALPVARLWRGGRRWRVVAGPVDVSQPGLDAMSWRWVVDDGTGPRAVEVQLSRTMLQVDPATLPGYARRARETRGGSVVQQLLARVAEPPEVIRVHSASNGLPQI